MLKFIKKYYLLFILGFICILSIYYSYSYFKPASKSIDKKLTPTNIPTVTPTPFRSKAKIIRVIDGDSLVLDDGRQIRLLGIDTPEMANDKKEPECFATHAKNTTQALVGNQEVELESDINDKDDYGRLLRYVYVEGIFVNEFLVRWGFARAETGFPEKKYRTILLEAQKEAQVQKRGLWDKCN